MLTNNGAMGIRAFSPSGSIRYNPAVCTRHGMRWTKFLSPRRPESLGSATHYMIAAGLLLLAVALRFVVAPHSGHFPFITFFPATALAALIGGLGPGMMVAAGGGFLAAGMFFPRPVSEFTLEEWVPVAFYVMTELIICLVIDAMHAANGRYLTLAEEVRSLRDGGEQHAAPDKIIRLEERATGAGK